MASGGVLQRSDIRKAERYTFSPGLFAKALHRVSTSTSVVLYFPDGKGDIQPYQVRERPVLSPELSAKYPGIRSFSGRNLKNPKERIRFSLSHKGIQAMMPRANGGGTTFMERIAGTESRYVVYERDPELEVDQDFICLTAAALEKGPSASTRKLVDDQLLRSYRIAVSASGEYTQFHGGSIPDALAAINATLTRVNEVYETDLGITLELVANTDQVIFTDPATDPYGANLNSEVQNTLTATIGEANYDLGHLFHQDNDSGNAGFIGSVCKDNQKGSAFSSALNPQGDFYDLDFVAHEIGHQFGANHTWSFESEGTGVQAEPGSGSTIMGYAGIVEGDNVQANGDDYFHYFSIFQISNYVQSISCGTLQPIANNPPQVTPTGNFVIPRGTAFVLTANATDPDPADVLTYGWEQVDDGVVTAATFGPTNAAGANFRSLKPGSSPSRYFPALEEVVQGNLTETNPTLGSAWETVSEVERDLNFALTVRDNAQGGGQVASDLVNVRVLNSAGPFAVSSQNSAETYMAGSVQTVSWNVAGTDIGAVNAQQVDIFLSTDGGLTFPHQLADATPNDGTQEVLLPGVATANARIMVKADANIFFALNASDFTIEEAPVVLQFETLEYVLCQPDVLDIVFSYEVFGGFNEEVTFSATGLPAGLGVSFSPATALGNTSPVTLSLTGTDQAPAGTYPFTVAATSAGQSTEVALELQLLDGTFATVPLNAPVDTATDISLNTRLSWTGDPAYTSYDIEIATDVGFTNILETSNVIFTSYLPSGLMESTTYFWRVRPRNPCGEGSFDTVFSFTTVAINCQSAGAADLPLPISSIGTPTVESTITFLDDLPIADVNVTLDLDHTFLGDLVITLISPAGTEVVLTSNSCGEFRNIDAVFDDEGSPYVCSDNPAISGIVKPQGSLASLRGESTFGTWTLRIADTAPADGGALNTFSLEVCVEGSFRPDADGDGVFDDGDDLCLGTPEGAEVNPDGCPVYRFAPDNFRVAIESESCIPSDNGTIHITATEILDYTVTVSGPGLSVTDTFTSSYQLGDLPQGFYSLCITGTDGIVDFEASCFDIVVTQPEPLSVATRITPDGRQAVLELGGAELYFVEFGGNRQQVTASEFVLDLKEGTHTLKVTTQLPCQGIYEEQLYVTGTPSVYPNPFDTELTLSVAVDAGSVEVAIFNAGGSLLERKVYQAAGGNIVLDFNGRPSGVYLLRVYGQQQQAAFKVIKR